MKRGAGSEVFDVGFVIARSARHTGLRVVVVLPEAEAEGEGQA